MKKYIILIVILLLVCAGCGKKKTITCNSDQGTIKVTYNKKTIVSYSATGYDFQFEDQKKYAEKQGIDKYIDEFEQWFTSTAPHGTCERSE